MSAKPASYSLPHGTVPQALCDGAGIDQCGDCGHLRDNHPAGTRSACPDYRPELIVRGGHCRMWMWHAPGACAREH